MLILITPRDNRIHIPRIGIEQLIPISFILHLKILNALLSLIPNKNIQHNKMIEIVNGLIDRLWLVSDLNLFVLEEGVFLAEIAGYEPAGALVFFYAVEGLG